MRLPILHTGPWRTKNGCEAHVHSQSQVDALATEKDLWVGHGVIRIGPYDVPVVWDCYGHVREPEHLRKASVSFGDYDLCLEKTNAPLRSSLLSSLQSSPTTTTSPDTRLPESQLHQPLQPQPQPPVAEGYRFKKRRKAKA